MTDQIKDFKVSIRCMTYNQKDYITDALDGFTMQKTCFPFLAIVMDDASTDGEQIVIESYLEKHFSLSDDISKQWETKEARWIFAQHKEITNCFFVVSLLKKNLYKQKLLKLELIKEWEKKSKYIALCEGDDYWTDPLKLQKQVDYLESHPNCCMSTHAAYFDVNGDLCELGCQHKTEQDLTTNEVIKYGGLYLATASLIFRKELNNDWPEWRKLSNVGDYPLQILGTLRGKLHFLPEKMCVYRYMHQGSWTYNEQQIGVNIHRLKTEIAFLNKLDEETDYRYSDAIRYHLIRYYSVLYRNNQAPFNDYYRVFKKVPDHSYNRLFKDIIIRNFHGLYTLYKKVIASPQS